jgi:hypothetical protein
MALTDAALVGADTLAGVEADPIVGEAHRELAQRALYQLHKSAGPLRTDNSRQMLVAGLRLFKHLEALAGAELAGFHELLDRVTALDDEAMRSLESALARIEGPRAARKGGGAAHCQLACEATLTLCQEAVVAPVLACQDRCLKSGAVRFSSIARPTSDPRWYCR